MANAEVQVRAQARELPRAPPAADLAPTRRLRAVPVLVTLIVLVLAGIGTWAAWQAYMAAPWTRDGTVRAYVVTITPEVSGRIVQLPVVDNQFVHKGDLLMSIDPTDYAIAVDLAQAAADQASANAENAEREAARRANLTTLETSVEEKQTYRPPASRRRRRSARRLPIWRRRASTWSARRSARRSTGTSPTCMVQPGDYATARQSALSVVDAEFLLGGWLFRGNHPRRDPCRRPGDGQADGLRGRAARPCRQHCARHHGRQRGAGAVGPGEREPDLHLGAAGAARAGAYPDRPRARRRTPRRRPDRQCADRAEHGQPLEHFQAWWNEGGPSETGLIYVSIPGSPVGTVEALWNAPAILSLLSPAECANFLRHAGYF